MNRFVLLTAALAPALILGGCDSFQIQDSYGNRYGGWYAHGDTYRVQMNLCEGETGSPNVPKNQKQQHMLDCMAKLGVPPSNTTPAMPGRSGS